MQNKIAPTKGDKNPFTQHREACRRMRTGDLIADMLDSYARREEHGGDIFVQNAKDELNERFVVADQAHVQFEDVLQDSHHKERQR